VARLSRLTAAQSVPILDTLGVPYAIDGDPPGTIAWREDGHPARTLSWPSGARGWAPAAGDRAAVTRDASGNLLLPFDPNAVADMLLAEGYRERRRARAIAASAYYRVRPAIPRPLQIALRRRFRHVQTRASFPAWPVEPALHDLYELVLGLLAELAQRPVGFIAPWPAPYRWSLVLTHDVETRAGLDNVDAVRRIERELGVRSSWNFVPRRYEVPDRLVEELQAEGHEVGVHGLHHDGRDLESRATVLRRLPEIRAAARRWDAVGFRSPALRRSDELIPLLGFDYDSSYPDTDPHGPDGGGCCSWLPYLLGGVVELPVTLPQDHTLFEILGHADASAWHSKADYLRSRDGMALLITHPDYLLTRDRLQAYRGFLEAFADDPTAWKALPREVCSWWRKRTCSRLVAYGDGWRVDGPAASDAAIAYAEPSLVGVGA
jgi:peptidoglycan/xylan/chitin deacetylase (PgdA/CDA1 family)